jgi:hypothetical protein
MLLAPNKMPLPMQGRTLELNLHQHKPTSPRVVNINIYETKWK